VGFRIRGTRRRYVGVAVTLFVVAALETTGASPANADADSDAVVVDATNGTGRAVTPGRSCDDVGGEGPEDDGAGAYWHYEYGAPVTGSSRLGNQPTEVLVHLDLHSDQQQFPNVSGDPYADGVNPTAFLQGSESHASYLTDRGSIKVRLTSGSCASPTLAFDGSTASGTGTWAVDAGGGEGAYRDVTGNGTFSIGGAEVNPGGDNALQLTFNGSFTVPNPGLQVEFLGSYWGGLGTDYLTRRVTTVYRITNNGPGDSYGGVVTGITDLTSGITPMIGTPIALNDLRAGESQELTFRHQMSLLTGPCKLLILNCQFDTRFDVNLPDALDNPHSLTATVHGTAPTLPPPL
jgi:hypothetical protein